MATSSKKCDPSHEAFGVMPTRGAGKVGAGIVLVRNTVGSSGKTDGPCFLLLRGTDTGVWSFPKGHTEAVDRGDPLATAIRETWEETGYRAGVDYEIVGDRFRLGKRPYWVGRMNATASWTPRLAPREHSTYGWFRAGDLERLTANTDVRALVKHYQNSHRTEHCCCRVIATVASAATTSSPQTTVIVR